MNGAIFTVQFHTLSDNGDINEGFREKHTFIF